ncbi:MAG: cupin domain-containing protein [Candidatus Pacebacteria bacterium]|nr:cupin domain-containing protein [Candidatus Paceibacterota bacterium]
MSYIGSIEQLGVKNDNFREVVFTGTKSQLVVMSIPVNTDVGEETHEFVEQTLYIISGVCKVMLNDEEHIVSGGDVVVVTPGTKHNFINVGEDVVKIITTYSPPNHIDGRVHVTKEDADNDTEDEAFGHQYTS